jgi:hypothetical protein
VIGGPCVMFIGVTLSRRHFLEDTLLAPHGIADTAAPELAVRCGEPWIGASPVTLGTQGRFAIGAQKRFARLTSRSRRAPIRNCRLWCADATDTISRQPASASLSRSLLHPSPGSFGRPDDTWPSPGLVVPKPSISKKAPQPDESVPPHCAAPTGPGPEPGRGSGRCSCRWSWPPPRGGLRRPPGRRRRRPRGRGPRPSPRS